MKKIILILLLIACLKINAQTQLPKIGYANINLINDYVSKNYSLKETITDTLCLYTVVFTKFKVGEKGKIETLRFNDGTPNFIVKAFTKAFKVTDGIWSTQEEDLKMFSKKIFILPIVLFYGYGCSGNSELSLDYNREQASYEYLKQNNTLRKANYSVQNILSFDKKQLDLLDCTILTPITFGTNH